MLLAAAVVMPPRSAVTDDIQLYLGDERVERGRVCGYHNTTHIATAPPMQQSVHHGDRG